jgi:PAS domain S-box-containing protein
VEAVSKSTLPGGFGDLRNGRASEYRQERPVKRPPESLEAENERLRARLEEAEQTLEAIRNGEVDAIVVSGADQSKIYTIESPDLPYRQIVETMNAGTVTLNRRGTILYANIVLAGMLGRPHEKLVGSRMKDLVSPSYREKFASFIKEQPASHSEEFGLLAASGEELFVQLSASIQSIGGKARTCLVITDISTRMEAERALKQAHDELETRVEERTEELSKANARLQAEIAERARVEEELRQSKEQLERRVRERTGELNEAYERLKKEAAEREKTEEQLRQAHKLEAVGTLAGGIAHDFNNMLAVIIGNAEMAFEDVENESAKRSVKRILDASMRSRELVKQILTFSRKNEKSGRPVKIVQLVGETYALLRSSLPSTIKMELKSQVSDDIIVKADPSQIQQVIVNLASNAAFAMRETGGTLTIGISIVTGPNSLFYEDVEPGRYVKVTVRDTGTGIPGEIRRRIFEPFFTTKKQGEGTGMGLAVVYGIVKGYGGTIEVESTPGEGSKFTVLLPEADTAPMEEEGGETLSCRNREHVLLVDDEPGVVETMEALLGHIGCRVTSFMKSGEALKAFRKAPRSFDLVITDQTMPEMTGIALANKLMAIRKDIPIILCTGYSETVSPGKAREAGIREFVMKPVTKKELALTIRRVLEQADSPPAPRPVHK